MQKSVLLANGSQFKKAALEIRNSLSGFVEKDTQ